MTPIQNLASLWEGDCIAGVTDLGELSGRSYIPNECMLLLCREGRAVVTLNSRRQPLRKGDLVVLFSDVLFSPVRLSPGFRAEYLCLSQKLMEKVYFDLTSESFWELMTNQNIFRPTAEQYDLLQGWFRQMEWLKEHAEEGNRLSLLQSNVYNLLVVLDGEARRHLPAVRRKYKKNRAWAIFGKFMSLLVKHCHETRETAFYAQQLCITTDYLYKTCNKVQHQTPKEIIDNFTVNEIKQYLSDTDLSVKDIARKFNFEDPSYMARFFRRMTGLAPLDFRNK